MLEANYGTEYSTEKLTLLFDTFRQDGWSEERFLRTLKWFIRHKQFPAWTIADWYNFDGIRVYPYEWYLKQCREGLDVLAQMDVYRLPNGATVYKWKDGNDLPLPKRKTVRENGVAKFVFE